MTGLLETPGIPTNGKVDEYQARYEAHQARKRNTLVQIMRDRHSDRMYGDLPVDDHTRAQLMEVAQYCPSSCDRHGVKIRQVDTRDEKELLGGILVGGVGWIHRAPLILMLMGDPVAYKAGPEIRYMPYLDAGVMVQQIMLRATDLGLASAYANPNIRAHNRDHFHDIFGPSIFCGAIAVGWPHPDSPVRRTGEGLT